MKNMKKVIAFLMVLCMAAPIFAQGTGWYPANYKKVMERQDALYNSLSKDQQDSIDLFVEENFDPIYEALIDDCSVDVSAPLFRLAYKYREVKEENPQMGRLLGAAMAAVDVSSEESEESIFFPRLVMIVATNLQNGVLIDATALVRFASDLQKDYDSFLKPENNNKK